MKFIRKKWFWAVIIIAILVVLGVVYGIISAKNANKTVYTTEDVKRGNIVQTVSATGVVKSAEDIDLNFKGSGKIISLVVKEGNDVKEGQILARIEDYSAQTAVKQARANLSSAQANLSKVRAGASEEEIKLAEEQLKKAEDDLDSLKKESEKQLENLQNKSIDALTNAILISKTSLDKINTLLLNKELTYNMVFENSNLLLEQKYVYNNLISKQKGTEELIYKAQQDKTRNSINSASLEAKSYMSEINKFINDSFALANSIVANNYYPQSSKDSIKNEINSQATLLNSSLTSVQAAHSNLTNSNTSYDSQIKALENNVNISRAQLSQKTAAARYFDIQSAQADVAQKQATLEGALNDLKNYVITAPMDGKIVKVNYSVGEMANNGQPVIKMLSDDKYEIEVDIPESDIAKIKQGDKAVIDLDAFGSEKKFNGTISFIDPAQTLIQDVVYYKTTVTFDDEGLESRIKPGMTANVTITTATKENVLYIPQRAVKIKETTLDQKEEKVVEVLIAPEQSEERVVATGLKADGGLVEIVSGLKEGDKVVVFKKTGK